MPRNEIIDEMNQVFMDNNCEKIRELFSPYIDGEVTNEERELVDNHIKECAECKTEHEKLKKTVEMLNFSALSPEEDLEKAVLTSIRSNARRNRFIRLGSTIAACFVLVVCVSAFGVLELMNKRTDSAMEEDSVNFAAYSAKECADQEKSESISPSRTLDSNTETENYWYYTDDSTAGKQSANGSLADELEIEAEISEESVADSKADSSDQLPMESYSDAQIEKYTSSYAPEFEGKISCVVITENDLAGGLDAVQLSDNTDFAVFALEFTKEIYGVLTSDLAEGDVAELASTAHEDGESFILYVKLK